MKKNLFFLLWLFILLACSEENEFATCDSFDILADCSSSSSAQYCLLGYKWGESAIVEDAGEEAKGPALPGGNITYSFHNSGNFVNYHLKENVPTLDFDIKGDCARDEIRRALHAYLQIGNFTFEEIHDDSPADIQFIVLDNEETNVGYGNFQDPICAQVAGQVMFTNNANLSCHVFFILALHEIGHALGLGHVGSENIMNIGRDKYAYEGLHIGDIAGIKALYGEK
jgi:hypothetical protein